MHVFPASLCLSGRHEYPHGGGDSKTQTESDQGHPPHHLYRDQNPALLKSSLAFCSLAPASSPWEQETQGHGLGLGKREGPFLPSDMKQELCNNHNDRDYHLLSLYLTKLFQKHCPVSFPHTPHSVCRPNGKILLFVHIFFTLFPLPLLRNLSIVYI